MIDEKEWLTTREIAERKVPGLPHTKRGVQLWLAREGFDQDAKVCRPRAGRGGGLEFHVSLIGSFRPDRGEEWFTPARLLAMNLPGLPGSAKAIRTAMERKGHLSNPDKVRPVYGGRAGSIEIHVSALPKNAQMALGIHNAVLKGVRRDLKREEIDLSSVPTVDLLFELLKRISGQEVRP